MPASLIGGLSRTFLGPLLAALVLLSPALSRAQLAASAWPKFQGNAACSGLGTGSGTLPLVQWQVSTPFAFDANAPAIGSDGTVYISDYNGNMYAFNGQTGAIKWQLAASNFGGSTYSSSSPAIGADGTIYFVINDPLTLVVAVASNGSPNLG